MKTVAIYCVSLRLGGDNFESYDRWEAYSDLALLLQQQGLNVYFVSGQRTYQGNGWFSEGYTLTRGRKVAPRKMTKVTPIHADIVFDRGDFAGTDVPMINPKEIYDLAADKTLMYETFSEYQPFSATCNNRQELEAALRHIQTDLAVVKVPAGEGGKGVFIGTKQEVLAKVPTDTYPLLAQEFMDTSMGIPGIVGGIHDLRIEIGGGEVWGSYVRTPKAGEYRANLSQGGTIHYLTPETTPQGAVELAKAIDSRFEGQPRFYSLDFANTTNGWKLIELNSRLGIGPGSITDSDAVRHTLTKFAVYLADQVRALPAQAANKPERWSVMSIQRQLRQRLSLPAFGVHTLEHKA
jgi:glutathione synthase/RimK-type ligase-like ATP-grasp enzyme